MANKKRNSFYIQGSILAAASILSRIIGLAFRIPISRMLGDVGYGAYSNAYEIYNMALILSTFSIPMAVSKLVSAKETKKEYVNSFRIFKVSSVFSGVIGLLMACLVWFFAEEIATVMLKSPNIALPLKALAPTIFVFALMGVLRGFFQGKNTVIPTSISQILEQIVHVVCGILFASLFLKLFADDEKSVYYGAAGATLGTLAGAVIALLFLAFIYFLYRPTLMRRLTKDYSGECDSYSMLLKMLLITVVPIILNQFLYSVTGNIDSVLLNHIMALKGVDEMTRSVLWGCYAGKFRLLVNVPLAIASAIGVAIIPNVVSAFTEGKVREIHLKLHQAVKLNMMIAIPCAFGLIALARPMMVVLFDDTSDMTVRLMQIGGMSVVFFAYSTTTNSILQGMGKLRFPVMHAIIGIIVYCIVDFWLMYYTDLGVYTLAIGYMIFPFTVGLLNKFRLQREAAYRQEMMKTFLLPTLYSAVMAVIAYFSYEGIFFLFGSRLVSLILAIAFSVLAYGGLMVFTRTISKEEILELPMGGRLVTLVEKTGFKL
ncbi:MAG: polysaccharide biosynthesis protein [Lachnospiraceae bacterium]|nr:polysaccharide biosynthesis protein [Lachnospiraceae bacterium]